MSSSLAWLVAVGSTVLCVLFWFRDVRRIMRDRQSTVDSAAGQLRTCQEKVNLIHDDSDAMAVLERSESIYRQAVELYDRTIRKPWIFLPARLMGFQSIS